MKAWEASSTRVDVLGGRLIVVLGHQSCGAVDAADEDHRCERQSARAYPVTGHGHQARGRDSTPKGDLDTTIKTNVKHVVDALRSSTPILKARVDSGEVQRDRRLLHVGNWLCHFSRREIELFRSATLAASNRFSGCIKKRSLCPIRRA